MTPKEKAKDLVEKFYTLRDKDANGVMYYNAKQCALIAVEEITKQYESWMNAEGYSITHPHYWDSVKTEIEKL